MARKRKAYKSRKRTVRKKGLFGTAATGSKGSTGSKVLSALTISLAAMGGAFIGGASPHTFYPGLAMTGLGAWHQEPHLIALGSTMSFSTGRLRKPEAQAVAGVDGLSGLLAETKERLKDFGRGLAEKSYVSKFVPGLGDVDTDYYLGNVDLTEFDRQVALLQQGAAQNQISGTDLVDISAHRSDALLNGTDGW